MKQKYYTELSGQWIYSLFYSSKKRKNNRFRNHRHTETELGLILKGSGDYMLGDHKFHAETGGLFIERSNEQHCDPTITTDTLVSFNIHLSSYYLWNVCSDYIPPHMIQALINSEIPIEHKITDSKILLSFQKIAKLYDSNPEDSKYEIRREVLHVVKLISDKIKTDIKHNVPHIARLEDIQKAIDYIRSNYQRPIRLDDIAKSAAMSHSYLSNTFKAATGMSPYSYLMTTRIEKAIEMLAQTDKTILNIALECGFSSLTAFNKAFKQFTGLTPTDLRRSYATSDTKYDPIS